MATDQHLQIINPRYSDECRSFPSFPRLPTELRLEIWKHSLQRPRLISILVCAPDAYLPQAQGSKLLSKLLRVNREARDAALRHYRVHLPCRFGTLGTRGRTASGTLFLNPEYDILHIQPNYGNMETINLICKLRDIDPLEVGLLNIAVDINTAGNLPPGDDTHVPPCTQATFKDILSNLRQVYFICADPAGHMYLGPRNGISIDIGFEYHRSRPILPSTPIFERVGQDPRPGIERDLSKVFVGTQDPRRQLFLWRRCLSEWGVQQRRSGGPDYRFLVGTGWWPSIEFPDRESANNFIRREEERWNNGRKQYATRVPSKANNVPEETPEELEHVPKPAIGFWVFPIEAIGLMPSEEETVDRYGSGSWRSKRVLDMRRYWPELYLAHMP